MSLSLEDAQRDGYNSVEVYDMQRLRSAIGYITPKGKLEGWEAVGFAEWKRKLVEAREARARLRKSSHSDRLPGNLCDGPDMVAVFEA